MFLKKTIRAWKDSEFLKKLDQNTLDSLPENPAGLRSMSVGELEKVFGGRSETDTTYCATIVPPCRKDKL